MTDTRHLRGRDGTRGGERFCRGELRKGGAFDCINLSEWKTRAAEFGHDFFTLDDEQARRLAVLLLVEGAETGDFGFGEQGENDQ